MVVSGQFMGTLVHTSGQPLVERKDPDGNVWVKGDAGDEFFVTFGQISSGTCIVQAVVNVDGADIGYTLTWKGGPYMSNPLGPLVAGQGSGSTMKTTAFKFMRHSPCDEGGSSDTLQPKAGTVRFTFFRVTECSEKKPYHLTPTKGWSSEATAANSTHKKETTTLCAGVGTTAGDAPIVSTVQYTRHEALATITVCYTTDFGIAVRGLYTPEEVNMPTAPPPKRVKKEAHTGTGTCAADAISLDD